MKRFYCFVAVFLVGTVLLRGTESLAANNPSWAQAVNLLTIIDPKRDAVRGSTWSMENGALVCGKGQLEKISIPYVVPEEYDFRIKFTPLEGVPGARMIMTKAGHQIAWAMNPRGSPAFGFYKHPATVNTDARLEYGKTYECIVQVRNRGLTVIFNGKQILQYKTDYQDMEVPSSWKLTNESSLGFGNCYGRARFESVDLLEITGKGRVVPRTEIAKKTPPPATPGKLPNRITTVTGTSRQTILRPADPELQKNARAFAKMQSTIKGLFVLRMSNGQRVGGAQDIIATAEYGRSGYETICKFASTVASDTYISLEEAVHLVKVRHPIWKAGQEVRVSYGDKYSRQSGGSAGAAFSLLLLSLLEGIQFDPAFGITGDVTVDGKIRKVGAVAEKVRGAALEKCRIVALPAVNKENLADLAVLYGPSMLWTVQLFSIENLDQAVAVARQDRAENLAKAITQFTEVQKALAQQVSVAALNNPAIVQALQEVLKLAPNHASAEYMLYGASGRLPRVLSLRGSLEEIWSAVGPMAMMLYAGAVKVEGQDVNEMIMSGFSTEMFKTVNDRLNWLTYRLDPRAQGMLTAMKEFVAAVSALKTATGSGTYSSQQFQAKKDKVLGESAKLDADRKVVEELMR